jgi:hypothetical protein
LPAAAPCNRNGTSTFNIHTSAFRQLLRRRATIAGMANDNTAINTNAPGMVIPFATIATC